MHTTLKTTLKRPTLLVLMFLGIFVSRNSLFGQSADLTVGGMVVNESLVTVKNNKLVFNGLSAQQVDEGFSIVGITSNANQGSVKFVGDYQIEYDPTLNMCDKSDMFSYMITNGYKESVKEVTVEILCETLAILSSMSPDGDGEQDSFVILGIDNYPNNELVIFNDLGLKIFMMQNYTNDWDGTYQNKPLPSGVYYYVFKPGNGETLSGYLQMGSAG